MTAVPSPTLITVSSVAPSRGRRSNGVAQSSSLTPHDRP